MRFLYITVIIMTIPVMAVLPVLCSGQSTQKAKSETNEVIGIWQGTLTAGSSTLKIVFRISKDSQNLLKAAIDSPNQRLSNAPVDKIELKGGKLILNMECFHSVYEGTIEGNRINGEWRQNGKVYPLDMEKVEKAKKAKISKEPEKAEVKENTPEIRRPQEPAKPYPYIEQNIEFENKSAGIKLAGTLTIPKSKTPVAVVVLVSGTGPQDRDESVFGHKPFLVLADYHIRKGIAVLRADDRGTGGSGGDYSKANLDDFAADVLSAVEYLKTHKEIDPKRIGVIGHSEGGFVAAKAAVLSEDIAFVVMMAGTGLPGEKVLYRQAEEIASAEGADEKAITEACEMQKSLFAVLKRETDDTAIEREIRFLIENEVAKLKDSDKKAFEAMRPAIEAQMKQIMLPSTRQFVMEDPKPVLMKLKCPVLAICGEKDLQISSEENLPAIEQALKDGGNTNYTIKEMPCLNHLFQVAKTGSPSEYATIEETISPAALKTIGDWILDVTKKK
jgi:uncharacterized protein